MGIDFKKLGGGLKTLGDSMKTEFKEAGQSTKAAVNDVIHGKGKQALNDLKNGAKDVGDAFFNGAAESVGVAELLGAKYPVKTYESKLDDHVTRGSRLSDQDIARLHQQGYKGVVNLCLENDDDSARAKQLGMHSLHIPILDNSAPTEGQVKQFLDFATSDKNQPCYFHCEAGQGRTGVMAAAYRMAVDGWSADQAITEGKQFGLKLPDQIEFLQQFGKDLQAGKVAGYPLKKA